jgi:hypothetical protein
LTLAVALLIAFYSPLLQHVLTVQASEPYITDILTTLGFNNVTPVTVETFPAGTYNITLYAKFGGYNPDNVDVNELSYCQTNTSSFNVLFTPSEPTVYGYVTPPLSKTFSANYQFDLSLLSWNSTRYYTETALNPDGLPHAQVYMNLNDPDMLLIGFDERSYCTKKGDGDFNDMVISLARAHAYYLNVVSPYDTPTSQGWYLNGTNAFASLADGIVDHGNETRRIFTQWSNDASGNNHTKSNAIYMDRNKTAIAVWNTQYHITTKTSPTGIATIPGEGWYNQSTSATLTAPSVVGYLFVYWDVDGASQGNGANPITITADGPHTATAHYSQAYTLQIEAGPGGSTTPPPGAYSATVNSTIQASASPNANFEFDHWELDGTNVGSVNTYSVLMDRNHILIALFRVLPVVTIDPTSAIIYVGQSVRFGSAVSGGTPPYTFQWYLNNNPVLGATSSSWKFTPNTAGTYYVYLKVTDSKSSTGLSQASKVEVTQVVGGYSITFRRPTAVGPLMLNLGMVVAFAIFLVSVRRKTGKRN